MNAWLNRYIGAPTLFGLMGLALVLVGCCRVGRWR